MRAAEQRIAKDIVLLGGGHAHVQVIRSFGMKAEPGVRLTLVSPDPHTPYSGMLPGLIAGHYSFDQSHIDLNALCRFSGVRYIRAQANGLDLAGKRVAMEDRPPLPFDILSIDTGSTPRMDNIPGAADFAIAVKPISKFLAHWNDLKARAGARKGTMRIAIVGAGAGGVELLLSAQYALEHLRPASDQPHNPARIEFHLFSRSGVLPGESLLLASTFARLLRQRGVHLHENETIAKVEKGLLRTASGGRFEADEILWVTAAGAPEWPRASGLAVDGSGFIAVGPTLQSKSHPDVFAAGDVAAMVDDPRPKAGVFAVRQGPVLGKNLRRAAAGLPLVPYRAQREFLKIISAGDHFAVASRNNQTLSGAWVWRWKDRIDRRFMAMFNELPAMDNRRPPLLARLTEALFPPTATGETDMRCGGCGAKIEPAILSRVLAQIKPVARDDVLIGLDAPDDAAVLRIPDGKVSVQSIDAFRTMIGDPYVFGKIAATHALGDLYAMGAGPQSALAIATLPPNAPDKIEADLVQMMQGAVEVLNAAGAALVGGHSAEGAETMLGFALTGLADPQHIMRKSGLRAGDALILVKPLGTGALLAADMRARAKGRDMAAAIDSMLQSNARASQIFMEHGASAGTDVTGFGFAGHLLEMLKASGMAARVSLDALPVLAGAREAMQAGIFSTLHDANAQAMTAIDFGGDMRALALAPILFDPQTAGGLLGGIPAARAEACLMALRNAGYEQATIAGAIVAPLASGFRIVAGI